MIYYTVKVEINTLGTETRDLRHFDTINDALVRFHSDLAKYVNNTSSILMMIINSSGNVIKTEKWEAPITSSANETEETN